jgi:uncharacterized protein involved in type VI secretion and phage assembly
MQLDPTDQVVEFMRTRFFGKYRGVVTDNRDPAASGRVKVKVPAVLGDLEAWAMPCAPYAGDGMGSYTVPEVGTGVWVEFEAGDPSYPIVAGMFWGDGQLPRNEKGTAATPPMKIVRTEKGLMVTLDDGSQSISVSDSDGNNILTIDVARGQITVKGASKAVVEAPQIELVENASHPVVFGDQLLQYLTQIVNLYQTHVHPGELALGVFPVTPAPPQPPMPPPTSALLSTRVKTG